jgi:hypothetical protein
VGAAPVDVRVVPGAGDCPVAADDGRVDGPPDWPPGELDGSATADPVGDADTPLAVAPCACQLTFCACPVAQPATSIADPATMINRSLRASTPGIVAAAAHGHGPEPAPERRDAPGQRPATTQFARYARNIRTGQGHSTAPSGACITARDRARRTAHHDRIF